MTRRDFRGTAVLLLFGLVQGCAGGKQSVPTTTARNDQAAQPLTEDKPRQDAVDQTAELTRLAEDARLRNQKPAQVEAAKPKDPTPAGPSGLTVSEIPLSSHDPDVLTDMGILALQKGDLATAEKSFRAALDIDPTHHRARVHLAQTLSREGRNDESAAVFAMALTKATPHPPGAASTESALPLRCPLEQSALPGQPRDGQFAALPPSTPEVSDPATISGSAGRLPVAPTPPMPPTELKEPVPPVVEATRDSVPPPGVQANKEPVPPGDFKKVLDELHGQTSTPRTLAKLQAPEEEESEDDLPHPPSAQPATGEKPSRAETPIPTTPSAVTPSAPSPVSLVAAEPKPVIPPPVAPVAPPPVPVAPAPVEAAIPHKPIPLLEDPKPVVPLPTPVATPPNVAVPVTPNWSAQAAPLLPTRAAADLEAASPGEAKPAVASIPGAAKPVTVTPAVVGDTSKPASVLPLAAPKPVSLLPEKTAPAAIMVGDPSKPPPSIPVAAPKPAPIMPAPLAPVPVAPAPASVVPPPKPEGIVPVPMPAAEILLPPAPPVVRGPDLPPSDGDRRKPTAPTMRTPAPIVQTSTLPARTPVPPQPLQRVNVDILHPVPKPAPPAIVTPPAPPAPPVRVIITEVKAQ